MTLQCIYLEYGTRVGPSRDDLKSALLVLRLQELVLVSRLRLKISQLFVKFRGHKAATRCGWCEWSGVCMSIVVFERDLPTAL